MEIKIDKNYNYEVIIDKHKFEEEDSQHYEEVYVDLHKPDEFDQDDYSLLLN